MLNPISYGRWLLALWLTMWALQSNAISSRPAFLIEVPEKVTALFASGRGLDSPFFNQRGLKASWYPHQNHPELQKWIDDLTFSFLDTSVARKSFPVTFWNADLMHIIYGVSKARAEQWVTENHFSIPKNWNNQAEINQANLIKGLTLVPEVPLSARVFNIAILSAPNSESWTGMTGIDGATILIFEKNSVTPLRMLQHLIHEVAIFLDPQSYDVNLLRDRDQKPKSFTQLEGLQYPAIALASQAMRALHFETLVLSELSNQYQMNFDPRELYVVPKDEQRCRAEWLSLGLQMGNIGTPAENEQEEIRAKFNELFKTNVSCLTLTRPDFTLARNHLFAFPGPRPRVGGG